MWNTLRSVLANINQCYYCSSKVSQKYRVLILSMISLGSNQKRDDEVQKDEQKYPESAETPVHHFTERDIWVTSPHLQNYYLLLPMSHLTKSHSRHCWHHPPCKYVKSLTLQMWPLKLKATTTTVKMFFFHAVFVFLGKNTFNILSLRRGRAHLAARSYQQVWLTTACESIWTMTETLCGNTGVESMVWSWKDAILMWIFPDQPRSVSVSAVILEDQVWSRIVEISEGHCLQKFISTSLCSEIASNDDTPCSSKPDAIPHHHTAASMKRCLWSNRHFNLCIFATLWLYYPTTACTIWTRGAQYIDLDQPVDL